MCDYFNTLRFQSQEPEEKINNFLIKPHGKIIPAIIRPLLPPLPLCEKSISRSQQVQRRLSYTFSTPASRKSAAFMP
jgi:hypothetical protein